jgi:hypothetical protein
MLRLRGSCVQRLAVGALSNRFLHRRSALLDRFLLLSMIRRSSELGPPLDPVASVLCKPI